MGSTVKPYMASFSFLLGTWTFLSTASSLGPIPSGSCDFYGDMSHICQRYNDIINLHPAEMYLDIDSHLCTFTVLHTYTKLH